MTSHLIEAGLRRPLLVREERLHRSGDACRLLYVSDVHLRRGRSEHLSQQVREAADRSRPDAVLLGGDLLDQPSELDWLSRMVESLRATAPVFAVSGNHDLHVGEERVRDAVQAGGGEWMQSSLVALQHDGRTIMLHGPDASPSEVAKASVLEPIDEAPGRLSAPPGSQVHVLCAHHPRIWKRARNRGYDLVLAGHLHGCQFVAFEAGGHLFPGALFYPHCCLRRQWGATRLVVSRGVSDLIPIRWGCPREVVLCYV